MRLEKRILFENTWLSEIYDSNLILKKSNHIRFVNLETLNLSFEILNDITIYRIIKNSFILGQKSIGKPILVYDFLGNLLNKISEYLFLDKSFIYDDNLYVRYKDIELKTRGWKKLDIENLKFNKVDDININKLGLIYRDLNIIKSSSFIVVGNIKYGVDKWSLDAQNIDKQKSLSNHYFSDIKIYKDVLIVLCENKIIIGLDLQTGETKWSFSFSEVTPIKINLSTDELLIFNFSGEFLKLNPSNGAILLKKPNWHPLGAHKVDNENLRIQFVKIEVFDSLTIIYLTLKRKIFVLDLDGELLSNFLLSEIPEDGTIIKIGYKNGNLVITFDDPIKEIYSTVIYSLE